MNIYLIRHAHTEMNKKEKMFCGKTDINLSEKGIAETQLLAQNPFWNKIEHIYISSLIRTRQTADILFEERIERTIVPELDEVNFGDYEGLSLINQAADDPIIHKWINEPERLTFPNGENLLEHSERAYNAILKIANKSTKNNIAIISHATTIRLVLSMIITGSIKDFRKIPCDNVHVSLLSYNQNKFKVEFTNAHI